MTDPLPLSELLAEREAARFIQLGHFTYEGGDHGDTRLSLELLFTDPRRLERAAARLSKTLAQYHADLVLGPLIGGALVAQWVARALDAGFVYAEPVLDGRYVIPTQLRPAVSGKRVIVVDDVINAGSATRACIRETESLGGRVTAVASLIVRQSARSKIEEDLGRPVEALLDLPWNTWRPSECPLCRTGVPLDETATGARAR